MTNEEIEAFYREEPLRRLGSLVEGCDRATDPTQIGSEVVRGTLIP